MRSFSMFLKSEEDNRRPDRKKYHFDPVRVLMGMAVGFIIPEIAQFLSEKVISYDTLENIAGVSSIGLAVIFGIIMLFVTFRVEMIYDDDKAQSGKSYGEQNEVTDLLSEYHEAKEDDDNNPLNSIGTRLNE